MKTDGKINLSTLFRFVNMRSPEVKPSENTRYTYISAPTATDSVFRQAIDGLTDYDEIQETLAATAATFGAIQAVSGVESIHPGLFRLGSKLEKKNKKVMKECESIESYTEKLTDTQKINLWDNLYFQAITHTDELVSSAIVAILKGDHLINSLEDFAGATSGADTLPGKLALTKKQVIARVADASVLIPGELISRNKQLSTEVVQAKPDHIQDKALRKLHDASMIRYEMDTISQLQQAIRCTRTKWDTGYKAAFDTAYLAYSESIADITFDIDGQPSEPIPEFDFTYDVEYDLDYLQENLPEEMQAWATVYTTSCTLNPEMLVNKLNDRSRELYAKKDTLAPVTCVIFKNGVRIDYEEKPAVNSFIVTGEANAKNPSTPALWVTWYHDGHEDGLQLKLKTVYQSGGSSTEVEDSAAFIQKEKKSTSFLFYPTIPGGLSAETDNAKTLLIRTGKQTEDQLHPIEAGSYTAIHHEDATDTSLDGIPGNSHVQLYGITKLKIADYIRVEQELECYIPGEVSHIENIMAREYREKYSRTHNLYEETSEDTEEQEHEISRDHSTTERYEMQSSVNRAMQEQLSTSFGINSNASYNTGIAQIGIGNNFDISSNSSSSSAVNRAENFAKEVVEKATEKILEKVSRKRTSRMLKEYEETNKHGFDNREGDKHVTGVYRWVDKIYRNRLVNYGRRLVYDFAMPEPSKNFKYWMTKNADEEQVTEPKIFFPENPDPDGKGHLLIIDSNNYTTLGSKFGLELPAPPEEYKVISKSLGMTALMDGATDGEGDQFVTGKVLDFEIPEGYFVGGFKYSFSHQKAGSGGAHTKAHVLIHDFAFNHVGEYHFYESKWYVPLYNTSVLSDRSTYVKDKLAVSVNSYDAGGFSLNVVAHCVRTEEHYAAWQAEVYAAIMKAYYQKMEDCNRKLEEFYQANSVTQTSGTPTNPDYSFNPLIAREIEKNEIKRLCIEMMTRPFGMAMGQHYYGSLTQNHYPLSLNSGLDKYSNLVRFFEEAFDWEIITYVFYPYFWGQKTQWENLLKQKSSADPLFQAFLQAGFSRVALPVKSGYEKAVLYFFDTGKVWFGQNFGVDFTEYETLYSSITDELAVPDEKDADYVETCWLTRVPTSLVIIQSDSAPLQENGLPCNCTEICEDGSELSDLEKLACKIGSGNNLLGNGQGSSNTSLLNSLKDLIQNGGELAAALTALFNAANEENTPSACEEVSNSIQAFLAQWNTQYSNYNNNTIGIVELADIVETAFEKLDELEDMVETNGCDKTLLMAAQVQLSTQSQTAMMSIDCTGLELLYNNQVTVHTDLMDKYQNSYITCQETIAELNKIIGRIEFYNQVSANNGDCLQTELGTFLSDVQDDLSDVESSCTE